MSFAELYIRLGFAHITDLAGYDHMMFLLALVAGFGLRDAPRVLLLVTAFTVGHACTLILTTLDSLHPNARVIEFLIPLTILLTSFGNFWPVRQDQKAFLWMRYGLALLFGFIHGMGFSTYFRSLLGHDAAIWKPLLWFNIGIEIGQMLIVVAILGLAWLVVEWLKCPAKWWRIAISTWTAIAAIHLLIAQAVG